MELNKIVRKLKIILGRIISQNIYAEMYLFGSILSKAKEFKDVDILIIYGDKKTPSLINNELSQLSLYYPLDLIFMTQEEEKELDFINKTNAENIQFVLTTNDETDTESVASLQQLKMV